MILEDEIVALKARANEIEHEIKRMNKSLALASTQIRSLQLGRGDDAHMALIALGVLASVSLVEAVAIVVLWVLR